MNMEAGNSLGLWVDPTNQAVPALPGEGPQKRGGRVRACSGGQGAEGSFSQRSEGRQDSVPAGTRGRRVELAQETGKVVWYSHFMKNFPQFFVIHTVKGFSVVNEAEVDVFLELSCFFIDPLDVGNLIYGSFAFSKSRLNIRNFMVHVLLKPGLENFEHYFTSM